jgi:hypothetical protein
MVFSVENRSGQCMVEGSDSNLREGLVLIDSGISKIAEGEWKLGYDLAEKPGFFTVKAPVRALVLPFARGVKDKLVLRIKLTVVELTAAPVADEFRQNYHSPVQYPYS